MKLSIHPASPNCMMALMALAELEIDSAIGIVDLFAGENREARFLSLNPNGFVPVLEDGDFVLWETQAILIYLASLKPGTSLSPDEPRARADVARWQFWSLAHWSAALRPFLFENYFKDLKGLGAPDQSLLEKAAAPFDALASMLERRLEARDFLVGHDLTLADIAAAGWLVYAREGRMPLERFANIRRWLAAIEQRPSWRQATQPWRQLANG
jgi:glutathione S-transferase